MPEFPFPKFKNPPVVEVVCGVQFDAAPPVRAVDLGLYWTSIRDQFPNVSEWPPLNPVVEGFGAEPQFSIEWSEVPPLPRLWFLSANGRALIQVQRDRFLYNWKKSDDADGYPSYDVVSREFYGRLDAFSAMMEASLGRPIQSRQFELTYVNHVPAGQEWSTYEEIGNVLRDHAKDESQARFLPCPEGLQWHTGYRLPRNAGRLHVTVQSATARLGGGNVLRIDLTARGVLQDRSADGMREWFDLAHEWIVKGFVDITNLAMHDQWGRQQ